MAQRSRGNVGQIISLEVNYERLFKKMDGIAAHASQELRTTAMRAIVQQQRRVLQRMIPVDTGWLATKLGSRVGVPKPSQTGAYSATTGGSGWKAEVRPASFQIYGSTFLLHDTFFVRCIPRAERFSVRTESNADRKKRLANLEIRGLNRMVDTGLVNIRTVRVENGVMKVVARQNRSRLIQMTKTGPFGRRGKTPTESQLTRTQQLLHVGYRIGKAKGALGRVESQSHTTPITLRKRLPWVEAYWHEFGTKKMPASRPFERAAAILDPQTEATFREMEARVYERYGRSGAW